MAWYYSNEVFTDPQDYWGFVYVIENLSNNKKYIGKKQFKFKKTKIVKGKKKRFYVESDWQTYYGSSDYLTEDVISFGSENFRRTILRLCNTKSECSYWEAYYQFNQDVLHKPDQYYNEWISVRIRRSNLIKA